ncbi:hypothetical protein [Pontixanthobacter sp. CEM42]|uniref:hypothetical protein n=1 Tax=Pontixanthobacter sp. CEM42 TaxID=2792077 RepID=UPI001AE0B291|nr:hypothetical protein [Pontixanthobacter sp. CEM42]
MPKSSEHVEHGKVAAMTTAGSVIAALVAFVQAASIDISPIASPFDEGFQVGQIAGIAVTAALVPWLAAYFLVIRDAAKADKWMSLSAMIIASIFGLLAGLLV